jgi:hypothetical protein
MSMRTPDSSSRTLSRQAAEEIAVSALGFIGADPALLPRFLSLTGIEISQIRQVASQPGFLAGVLQFIMAHEPTLTAFCAATETAPQDVAAALRALPFGEESYDISS